MTEPRLLVLPADCSLRTIRSLHGEISSALEDSADLILDGAGIERADVTFVQVVVSTLATAGRRAGQVTLANMPAAVEAAFRRAGVAVPGVA
ncbi:MAG: STAS domain-containing protein [Methylobacterium frigidaeris]